MTSETNIENQLGYLPTNKRDFLWFAEGVCAGASIVLVILAAAFYFGGLGNETVNCSNHSFNQRVCSDRLQQP
ncbi:hypothetical protein ACFQ2T_05065 [Methylophilus flavus]|uniref:Uncharacterized protein n=1 Tax=Methylophilus flavus TaxID=640084 RepID=A0ABW3P709_9PROT